MNYLFAYNSVAPTLPVQPVVQVRSPQNVLNGKERDNTWLQLPVCLNLTKKLEEREDCPEDAKCRANYGHPPKHVLEHLLTSGYIVCCQAYIFANFGSTQTPERPGCSRGEASCKYYHPPENLALLVINAGRNNKRLRSEVAAKLKLAATASAPPISASTIPTTSTTTTSSNLVSLNPLTSSFNSLANFCYPQYPQQQLAMSSLQQQFQNMVPYYVHQQQPTVTIANAEPLPPGIQHIQEEETQAVIKRKRQISPRPRGCEERSPEPKRRSLSLVPDHQPQPRLPQAYQQPLQNPYYLSPPATTLSPSFTNTPIYFLPSAQPPQFTWPYDPTSMTSYFQSTL